MMSQDRELQLVTERFQFKLHHLGAIAAIVGIGLFSAPQPALAHHAMDGRTPSNLLEGFLSGLAHPLIGLDHLAFVVAIGLLAVGQARGILLPSGFVIAGLAGTAIHLLRFDLPATEMAIAVSVIAFGAMLVLQQRPNWWITAILATIAGLFHGYAYGEAIVGAQMSPLFAYLLGFTLIQYVIALAALQLGAVTKKTTASNLPWLRLAGLVICSIGVVFLTSAMQG